MFYTLHAIRRQRDQDSTLPAGEIDVAYVFLDGYNGTRAFMRQVDRAMPPSQQRCANKTGARLAQCEMQGQVPLPVLCPWKHGFMYFLALPQSHNHRPRMFCWTHSTDAICQRRAHMPMYTMTEIDRRLHLRRPQAAFSQLSDEKYQGIETQKG